MERYNRERYDNGDYNNRNRYDDDNYNRIYHNRDERLDYNRNNRFDRDSRLGHELGQEFKGDYQHSDFGNTGYRSGDYRSNRNAYRGDENRGGRFQNYRTRYDDRDTSYASNFRGEENSQGNIRQGYGISSFDGTSDRYNTLNSDQRDNNMQEEQYYYSGNRDHLSSTRYGGGLGDEFPNSNRGVPNYALRNFADDYGAGMGSSYGGKNYGPGTGYRSGNRGGSFGDNTYGTSSGNYGGYGSMGGGTYGGGQSSYGAGSSHNSDRRNTGDYGYY